MLVEEDKSIHGLVPSGSSHLAVSGQLSEECSHLLFSVTKAVPGPHVLQAVMAVDPIAVGALGMDGIMTSSHEVAHFVKYFGRHMNLRRPGHVRSLVSRGVGHFWTTILHMADLLETGPNIALSGRFACYSVASSQGRPRGIHLEG